MFQAPGSLSQTSRSKPGVHYLSTARCIEWWSRIRCDSITAYSSLSIRNCIWAVFGEGVKNGPEGRRSTPLHMVIPEP